MKEEIRELTSSVMSYIRENSLVSAPVMHGTAGANSAVIASIVACMLLGKSDVEILDDMGMYRAETSKRFLDSAKTWYKRIRRDCPDEFSQYLIGNAKNVTLKKKRLPKPKPALVSRDVPFDSCKFRRFNH